MHGHLRLYVSNHPPTRLIPINLLELTITCFREDEAFK